MNATVHSIKCEEVQRRCIRSTMFIISVSIFRSEAI